MSAPDLAVPDPRVPGTSRWYVVGALARAGVLVAGGLALLAMIGWPEDHIYAGGLDPRDFDFDDPIESLLWNEQCAGSRFGGSLGPRRDDSLEVLQWRIEQALGLDPMKTPGFLRTPFERWSRSYDWHSQQIPMPSTGDS